MSGKLFGFCEAVLERIDTNTGKQLYAYISISRPKAWMPGGLCPAQNLGVSSFWPYQRGQGTGLIPIERVGEGESGMGADGHSLRA